MRGINLILVVCMSDAHLSVWAARRARRRRRRPRRGECGRESNVCTEARPPAGPTETYHSGTAFTTSTNHLDTLLTVTKCYQYVYWPDKVNADFRSRSGRKISFKKDFAVISTSCVYGVMPNNNNNNFIYDNTNAART